MSFERLIAEHALIEATARQLLELASAARCDLPAVAQTLERLASELTDHLAHEDSFIYPRMIAAENTEMAEAAQGFVDEFSTLRTDWSRYLGEWTGDAIASDWHRFGEETRVLLTRLAKRVRAENDLLYPAALRSGVIPLRAAR